MDVEKEYTNDEITVVWKPKLCIHSTNCFSGLIEVFNPQKRPWINIDGATKEKIIDQVNKCPSGALSYYLNKEINQPGIEVESETIVEVSKNGPLLVYGNIKIKDSLGNETTKNKVTALCRCGSSNNKPYCDGTHKKIGFKDSL